MVPPRAPLQDPRTETDAEHYGLETDCCSRSALVAVVVGGSVSFDLCMVLGRGKTGSDCYQMGNFDFRSVAAAVAGQMAPRQMVEAGSAPWRRET